MTNAIGTDAGKLTRQQQQQPKLDPIGRPGAVLVSPDKKSKGLCPVCYACEKQHEREGEMCGQMTEKVRASIGKLVAASTFDDKSSSGGNGGSMTWSKTSGGRRPTPILFNAHPKSPFDYPSPVVSARLPSEVESSCVASSTSAVDILDGVGSPNLFNVHLECPCFTLP